MYNGSWRILTGQISDFMQKKISDVQRRILNASPGIVVLRATWFLTKKKTAFQWRRRSTTASQQLKIQSTRFAKVAPAEGPRQRYRLVSGCCRATDSSPAVEEVEITQQTGHDKKDERWNGEEKKDGCASANVSQFNQRNEPFLQQLENRLNTTNFSTSSAHV